MEHSGQITRRHLTIYEPLSEFPCKRVNGTGAALSYPYRFTLTVLLESR